MSSEKRIITKLTLKLLNHQVEKEEAKELYELISISKSNMDFFLSIKRIYAPAPCQPKRKDLDTKFISLTEKLKNLPGL